jgi:hypothetical protein
MSEWVSVKDRLPEMNQDVLAFCVSNGMSVGFMRNTYAAGETYISIDCLHKKLDSGGISFRTDRYYGKVTHWMHIPTPPPVE